DPWRHRPHHRSADRAVLAPAAQLPHHRRRQRSDEDGDCAPRAEGLLSLQFDTPACFFRPVVHAAGSLARMEPLGQQALKGMGEFAVAMALLLFIPAWTLAWPEAWIFLAVFLGACALITLNVAKRDPALLRRRMNAGPRAEKERSQQIIQVVAMLA